MKKQNKQLLATISSNVASILMNFGISFLITPYITNKMGVDAYGFISLANNIMNYATIMSIALNSFATRFISLEFHKGNINEANKYYSTVYYANIILATTIFLFALLGIVRINYFLAPPEYLLRDVQVLFAFTFVNFALVSISTAYSASAYIKDRLELVGICKTVGYAIEALFLVGIYSYANPKVFYMGIGVMLFSLFNLCANKYISKKYTPELYTSRKLFSFKIINRLVLKGIWNSINQLGNTLNSGLDLLITNMYFDAVSMGEIAVAKTIGSACSMIYQAVSQAFQPLFLKRYARDELKYLLSDMKLSMKISGLFSSLILAGFISLGESFYYLWLPEQNIRLIYYLTIMTLLSNFLEGPVGPLYYIYTLTVKNKVPCIITLCGGIANVLGMILLINYTSLGIYSVTITTAVIMIFINLVTNPIYMTRCLKIRWYTFYPILLRYIFACILMLICMKWLVKFLVITTWLHLFLAIMICTMIGATVYAAVILEKSERIRIFDFIRFRMRRV